MTRTGNTDAANALTTNSVFRFCVVISWSGSNKEDRKNARVVIRYIMAVCREVKLARCLSSGNGTTTDEAQTSRLYEAPRNKVINRNTL
jgi:biotin synthase-like enzyme